MAKRNALMEWLDQTKKLAKAKDYAVLDVIDKIFEVIPFIQPGVLFKHREILDDICAQYHKPNPIHFIRSRRKRDQIYDKRNSTSIQKNIEAKLMKCKIKTGCPATKDWHSCGVSKFGINLMSKFVDGSLARMEAWNKEIVWQWFEVIDFMYERPELINPDSIDGYVEERITFVCSKYRKNNPLANGMRKRFGKQWLGRDGKWHQERRRRF